MQGWFGRKIKIVYTLSLKFYKDFTLLLRILVGFAFFKVNLLDDDDLRCRRPFGTRRCCRFVVDVALLEVVSMIPLTLWLPTGKDFFIVDDNKLSSFMTNANLVSNSPGIFPPSSITLFCS